MTLKDRYAEIVQYFSETMPQPETELKYNSPYELLVAVILSAQCTDKRVNIVTPELFKAFPNPKKMANADHMEVFEYIKSISYPNNKAKHLVGMAQILLEKFNGNVPGKVEDLTLMPGVGRKTANVIASVIHQKPTMAVDTHVFRVSQRMGLVGSKSKTPLAVEKDLTKNLKNEIIPLAHHWLILHGRYICVARNPKCSKCGITVACKSFEKIQKYGIEKVDKALPKIA
jgi:endonuclease III